MKIDFSSLSSSVNMIQERKKTKYLHNNYNNQNIKFQQKQYQTDQYQYNANNNNNSNQLSLSSQSVLNSYLSQRSHDSNSHLHFSRDKQSSLFNISLSYPYKMNSLLNSSNYHEQIQQIQHKNIIPESAIKFIKRQIQKSIEKSKEKSKEKKLILLQEKKKEGKNNEKESICHLQTTRNSIQTLNLNSSIYKVQKNKKENLYYQNEQFSQSLIINEQQMPINTILFDLFTNTNHKSNNKPKHHNFFQSSPSLTLSYQQPLSRFQHYQPSEQVKYQKQLKLLQQRPNLTLTAKSKYHQKVSKNRQQVYKNDNINIFDSLYNEAKARKFRKNVTKQSLLEKEAEEIQKSHVNNIYKIKNKFNQTLTTNSQYTIQETFYQRLSKSIQQKYNNQKLIKKYQKDQNTGQQLFYPNLKASQKSYKILINHNQSYESLSTKQKLNNYIQIKQQNQYNKEKIINRKKEINMKNSQLDKKVFNVSNTSFNNDNIVVIPSNHKQYNNSMKITTSNTLQQLDKNTKNRQSPNLSTTLQRLSQIFYISSHHSAQQIPQINPLISQYSSDFLLTTQSISLLSQRQFTILEPFLNEIQQIKANGINNINKVDYEMFKQLFCKFYEVISCLFILQRLDCYEQVLLAGKKNEKNEKNQKNKNKLKYLKNRMHNNISNYNNQIKIKEKKVQCYQNITDKPQINSLSKSLQRINPKYNSQLYYV